LKDHFRRNTRHLTAIIERQPSAEAVRKLGEILQTIDGVGPLGWTIGRERIDRRAGLSKEGSPWPSTAATASSSSARSPRSFWRARPFWVAKRHDLFRNLIQIWVKKYEAGEFDEDAAAADLIQQYEARIAALERLVGKQALELEFLKGAVKSALRPKSATTSFVVADPVGERSGFAEMLERLMSNGARTIIVESPDRFARDLMVQLAGHDMLKAKGIALVAASAPHALHRGYSYRHPRTPSPRRHRRVREDNPRGQAGGRAQAQAHRDRKEGRGAEEPRREPTRRRKTGESTCSQKAQGREAESPRYSYSARGVLNERGKPFTQERLSLTG
jgi:hypothetical protein